MQSEILSDEELADITGYKARAYQRRWLDDRKWLYVESRGKRPLVGRQYARMKLGMISPTIIDPNPPPAVPAWTPDFSRVNLYAPPQDRIPPPPPRMYQRSRTRKNGQVWTAYYYRDLLGNDIPLGKDLDKARIKWAELEAKEKPLDLRTMKGIFDRYIRDIIPKKAARTQEDNMAEIKQLRPMFDSAPIDSITPATIAGYRDARSAKVRANREIATLSHVFNMAREWGLTTKENPCQGVRKNKETPRDYYANDVVWNAVYQKSGQELKDAMDLAYLTGQRPADVLVMRKDDIEGGFLMVQQNKTSKKLRIQITTNGLANSLGQLMAQIATRNAQHVSSYLIVSKRGKRMTPTMLRKRWDEAREKAKLKAIENGDTLLAGRIAEFQFRDIRPKAASEIKDISEASLLLGHTKGDITERVYRRVGAIAQPSK